MSDDYETRRQERREEERRYQSDVAYDVWRSGGDMDRVDRDRVSNCFRDGVDCFSAADREVLLQRRKHESQDEEYETEGGVE